MILFCLLLSHFILNMKAKRNKKLISLYNKNEIPCS